MKYLVELSFTNPSHEHVSLRRRVEKVTRIVEATNEDQAILRASQQQRSLGFFIKEAKVVKDKEEMNVGDEEKTEVASAGKVMKKAEKKDKENEEAAEEVEEGAKDWQKAFKKVAAKNYEKDIMAVRSSAQRLDKAMQSFSKPDTKPADSNIDYIKQKVRKGVTKPHSMQEESGDDKRDAGYKMSPAVRAAQKKSDALSKVVKRPQAGTLAAVHKSMERTMERNMKTEEKKPEIKSHKARKAAEKMINKAKGRMNKINMNPEIEVNKGEGK